MTFDELKEELEELRQQNLQLEERERELAERNEELQAQKEELTAAIEALFQKSDSLTATVSALQQRNAELDQILYRASHDLRSPIASIEGIIQLLEKEIHSDSGRELKHHLVKKMDQLNHLLRSLNIFAAASFDHLDITDVNIHHVVENALHEIDYVPNYKNVKVQCSISRNLVFPTDITLFTHLIKCIVSNAFIFRNPVVRGFILIDSDRVENDLVITVIDDGEGIPLDVIPKVYDMFYRASDRSIGSGLGLYIARQIVQRFHGHIEINSVPGRTMVRICIPDIRVDNVEDED